MTGVIVLVLGDGDEVVAAVTVLSSIEAANGESCMLTEGDCNFH